MKTKIYYFTGTGNSLYISKKLAEKLKDCEIIPIKKALKDSDIITGERIGLVFPVYMHRIPHLMVKFIKKIKAAHSVFAVANNAGAMGKSLKQVNQILSENGLILKAGFSVLMPSNYIPWGGALSKDRLDEIFLEAENKINRISETLKYPGNYMDHETSWFSVYFIPGILYKLGYKMIPQMGRSFWADEKCNQCGICVKICPVNNICITDQKPNWGKQCEQCFACLQWCPQEAIQYKKSTQNKKRYQNPEIHLKEVLEQKN